MVRLLPPERDLGVLRAPVKSSAALVGTFLIVLLAVTLLDRIGASADFAPVAIVGAAFVLFALAAFYSHSRRATDFYVADRKVSGAFGGLAAGSAFAGFLSVGLVGGAFASTTSFAATAIGLAVGQFILGIVIAPGLRAFGAYTAGDFIAARFGGSLARLIFAAIAFTASALLLVAALKIAGPLVATLLKLSPDHALYLVAGVMVLVALPGGMRSLSWTQAIQYLVIAIACLVPAAFFAAGAPTGESALTEKFGAILVASLPSWTEGGAAGWLLPLVLAAFGIASLPQLNARALAAPSAREAAGALIFGMLFSLMLALCGFVLFDLLAEAGPADAAAGGGGLSQIATLFAVLPPVLQGLVLAGMLAALFALGQSALFAAATAVSHDVWDEIIDRRGPEGRRIVVARVALVAVAAGAVALVPLWPADAAALVGWALALAAAGSFVPLVLGLWWRRCNDIGALAGMVAGSGFTGLVFLLSQGVIPKAMVTTGWAEVSATTAACAGLLMSLVVTVGLSLVTPAPEADARSPASRPDESRGALPVRERPA